jgi:hypothetical protein
MLKSKTQVCYKTIKLLKINIYETISIKTEHKFELNRPKIR